MQEPYNLRYSLLNYLISKLDENLLSNLGILVQREENKRLQEWLKNEADKDETKNLALSEYFKKRQELDDDR